MIKPVNENVVIRPTERAKVSPGGIIIEQNEASQGGIREGVVAVSDYPDVQPGDRVLFVEYNTTEVDEYLVVPKINVLAAISD